MENKDTRSFKRMLKECIYYQGNASNAYDWIGPLRDATPKTSPFWEPVNTTFEAVEAVMNGVSKHPDPNVTQLAETLRKNFEIRVCFEKVASEIFADKSTAA
jgi:hypothetical protein